MVFANTQMLEDIIETLFSLTGLFWFVNIIFLTWLVEKLSDVYSTLTEVRRELCVMKAQNEYLLREISSHHPPSEDDSSSVSENSSSEDEDGPSSKTKISPPSSERKPKKRDGVLYYMTTRSRVDFQRPTCEYKHKNGEECSDEATYLHYSEEERQNYFYCFNHANSYAKSKKFREIHRSKDRVPIPSYLFSSE